MGSLIGLLIALIIAAVIFGVVVWVIKWIAPPAPFDMVIKAVVGLILLVYLLGLLVGYTPLPTHFWK
jgi:ABC-type multidrug transport system permease subunit